MRTAVISDIHANLEALRVVLDHIDAQSVDHPQTPSMGARTLQSIASEEGRLESLAHSPLRGNPVRLRHPPAAASRQSRIKRRSYDFDYFKCIASVGLSSSS